LRQIVSSLSSKIAAELSGVSRNFAARAHSLSKFYQQSVGSIDSNESNAWKFEINNDINRHGDHSREHNNVQPTARLRFSHPVSGDQRTNQRKPDQDSVDHKRRVGIGCYDPVRRICDPFVNRRKENVRGDRLGVRISARGNYLVLNIEFYRRRPRVCPFGRTDIGERLNCLQFRVEVVAKTLLEFCLNRLGHQIEQVIDFAEGIDFLNN
jgi:hypothetical protein